MVWVKLDDHFDQNTKIASVGPLGIALWTVGLAYCNRNLTDGFIPWTTARSLLSWEYLEPPDQTGARRVQTVGLTCGMSGGDVDSAKVIALLIYAGLWEVDEDRGGYVIHDYDDYQPTKAAVEAERANKQAAGKAGGQASAQARAERRAQASAQAESNPVPVPVPVTSNEVTSIGARAPRLLKPKFEALTDTERGELLTKWLPRLPDADEHIELALAHDAHWKYPTGQKRYVDNWLKNTLGRNGNGNGSNVTRGHSFPKLTRAADAQGPGRTPDLVG
jgi:hypothetical protein